MTKNPPTTVETINQVVQRGADLGVIQLLTDDVALDGRVLPINGKELLNFSSCSYLGYEIDERIKNAAKEAIDKYGTQFSASRAFVAINLYEQLEEKLEQLFGYPTVMAPTTTLGHIANMPIFVSKKDAVILDHQVHTSVRNAVKLVEAAGAHVETIRHNRLDTLEERIIKLSSEHRKVWYMADGVYSMFGNGAPAKEIYDLLEKHDQFHFYVDDAHGMSWIGKNGVGHILNEIPYHPKMILISSFTKSFGTQGGAMIFPDQKTKQLVKNSGSTLIFSSPIVPATLGASIMSADIHMSNELPLKQQQLQSRIKYAISIAKALNLPLVGEYNTPINFVGVGTPDVCYNIAKRMFKKGYLLSSAVYPSVPFNNAGLRFTITLHQSHDDIRKMLFTLSEELEIALKEEKYEKDRIFRAFRKHGFFKNKPLLSKAS